MYMRNAYEPIDPLIFINICQVGLMVQPHQTPISFRVAFCVYYIYNNGCFYHVRHMFKCKRTYSHSVSTGKCDRCALSSVLWEMHSAFRQLYLILVRIVEGWAILHGLNIHELCVWYAFCVWRAVSEGKTYRVFSMYKRFPA